MVPQLSVVMHDFILGFNDFWIVLEVHVSCDEPTVQLNDLRDLQLAMSRLVKATGRLNDLEESEEKL